MRKHRLGKQLLIVLCVVLIVFLAGCRPSPVLEQIIYEQNHQVDPDTETKTMNDDLENEEPDEDIPSRETVDDSEQTKDESHTAALAGDTDTSDDTDAVYDVAYSPSGDLSEPDESIPSDDSASNEPTGSQTGDTDKEGHTPVSDEPGLVETNPTEPTEESDKDKVPTDDQDPDSPEINPDTTYPEPTPDQPDVLRQIEDAAGRKVDIPENVNSVTAVGEAATIVEMLDNSGRLVGTSRTMMDKWASWNTSFNLDGVNAWWGNDTADSLNIDALVNAHPDVCFYISGDNTFSEDQLAQLNAAGITYFVLPAFSSIENIERAVYLVGEVLNDNDAKSTASAYRSWAEDTVAKAGGGSTRYTAYIGSWAPNDYWYIYNTSQDILAYGYGLPVGMKNLGGKSPLDDCMSFANVVNLVRDGYYVEPVRNTGADWRSRLKNDGNSAKYDQFSNGFYYGEVAETLGTTDYPAVIVEDSSILDNMTNVQTDGMKFFDYHWIPGSPWYTGTTWIFGFDDGRDDGQVVPTHIGGEYDIFVNPSGVGRWADGSVESPLEAVWLSCVIQGTMQLSEVQGLASEFYNNFYGTSNVNISEMFPYPSGWHVDY